MERKALLNIAASSLIVATTMVGCSGASLNTQAGGKPAQMEKRAAASAAAAEKALAGKDAAKAVSLAEAAVAADNDNAAWRTLLGRAYLAAGRFASAQTALQDALSLGSTDARTLVSLALVQTAQGRGAAARELLFQNIDQLSAADYGLAMAMAGDPDEAIRVLGQAIHAPGATARERQNLAYAYALAGRWSEARLMAQMDMAPLAAAQRVTAWARMAQPDAQSARVIAMLGVQPDAQDGGMPAALALAPAAPAQGAPVEMASVEPAAPPAPVAAPAEEAPVIRAPHTPVREASAAPAPAPVAAPAKARPLLVAARPQAAPDAQAATLRPVSADKGSAWLVQLGAYDSAAIAKERWQSLARRNGTLAQFPTVTTAANVNGRTYHRLAVAGFANAASARQLCASIRAQGSACFVRMGGPEASPAKWAKATVVPAAKKPQQIAMR